MIALDAAMEARWGTLFIRSEAISNTPLKVIAMPHALSEACIACIELHIGCMANNLPGSNRATPQMIAHTPNDAMKVEGLL